MVIYILTVKPTAMRCCALMHRLMTVREQAQQLALSALSTTEFDASPQVSDGQVEDTTKLECLRVAAELGGVDCHPV